MLERRAAPFRDEPLPRGDGFVYLPKERTVITGDAVIGWTPFMGDGYPEDWVTTIDRLAELVSVIPGYVVNHKHAQLDAVVPEAIGHK